MIKYNNITKIARDAQTLCRRSSRRLPKKF